MSTFNDFRLSCCKMLEQHPLYHYRQKHENGYLLNVLLIGSGTRMETITNLILTHGQLLDTRLEVTVLHPGVCPGDKLAEKAPALSGFVRIHKNKQPLSDPEDPLAVLRFEKCALKPENMEQLLAAHPGASYLIVSTGNDERNQALAQACADRIRDRKVMVAYVQGKGPDTITMLSPVEMYRFGGKGDETYFQRLERVAYNLHYAYAKSANDRERVRNIQKDFQKPYNYLSNMEAAIHIHSKLACCGIETTDPAAAAAAFARLMREEPAVVDRLAALEHRRWMMEKLLQGYRPQTDLTYIYSAPGVNTKDTANKWHTCLVPCYEGSAIRPEDWDAPDIRPDLDPLDRVSIGIHRQCGELARINRGIVDNQIRMIRTSVDNYFGHSYEMLDSVHQMELAISRMYQQSVNAIPIFNKHMERLRRGMEDCQTLNAALLSNHLQMLEYALAPLQEYISFKNYKDQDTLLIRQIPFALTHRTECVVMKLMAERETDCLLSPWQMEPTKILYMCRAETAEEMQKIRTTAAHIGDFLRHGIDIPREYHIFMSPELMDAYEEMPLPCSTIYNTGFDDPRVLMAAFREAAQDLQADYLDVTGGDPELILAAMEYARETGTALIHTRDGRLRNLSGAPEVEYPAPGRKMTVAEMFALSGAVVNQIDSEQISDLSSKYQDLWNIANACPEWAAFCTAVATAYKNFGKRKWSIPHGESGALLVEREVRVHSAVAQMLMPVLKEIEKRAVVEQLSVSQEQDDIWKIGFRFLGERGAETLVRVLTEIETNYHPGMFCQLESRGGDHKIWCFRMSLEGMQPEVGKEELTRTLLKQLAQKNLILNLKEHPQYHTWSFLFSSKDILFAFQLSGKVLEYYLYYSALLEGHFDDVQMGWDFSHSTQKDAARNELDLICTRGMTSLFVSAKNVTAAKFCQDSTFQRTVYYEISLMAKQFGINAKPVLVVPSAPMFETQGNKQVMSQCAKNALARGVYLIGQECFRDGRVAQVLDNIADAKRSWWET